MSSNLRPFSFIFILEKRKIHKGQDQVNMEGGIQQEYFLGSKTFEWKGQCEQEHCRGEETNHF
jgi:hypothetical protein